MKEQKISCTVYDCKHCNCEIDCCSLKQIKVCNCSHEQEKKATMCDSYNKRQK